MPGMIKLAVSCQLVFLAWAFPVAAAPGSYETVLGPTPINHATRTALTGEGAAIATLAGDTLKISGAFQGLSGPATDAHVMMGEGIGIPGNPDSGSYRQHRRRTARSTAPSG